MVPSPSGHELNLPFAPLSRMVVTFLSDVRRTGRKPATPGARTTLRALVQAHAIRSLTMSRVPVPFVAPDLSRFARALGRALQERHAQHAGPPGHVELMNLLARAAGHRNLQSLQAAAPTIELPRPAPSPEDAPSPPALTATARKALSQFDARGRLVRWPHKFSVQRLAMWALWTRFDARRIYTEREVNELLKAAHTYGDHVTLRRELVNHRLLARESDCSAYWKLPQRPDEDVRWYLHAWRQRQRPPAAHPQPGATPDHQRLRTSSS